MSLGEELETNMTRRNWKSYVLELVIYWSCTGGFDGSDSDMGGGGGGGSTEVAEHTVYMLDTYWFWLNWVCASVDLDADEGTISELDHHKVTVWT